MAKPKKSLNWVDKKFEQERRKIFKKYGPIEGEEVWRNWFVKNTTKKPVKKVARASTKSMNSSIPGDKRINNPKPKSTLTKAKLNMGGAANKKLSYGGLKGGKRKK